MSSARHTPIPSPTAHRTSPTGRASDALQDITTGGHASALILTFGQFSIGDAVRHLLAYTGPAHVTVATWTAAAAEIERAYEMLTDQRITGMRWIVDRSFATRQPQYCRALVDRFGADAIRTTRTHAKFVVIRGETEPISIVTSCNLNANPRLETILAIRGEETAAWFDGIVADIWASTPAEHMGWSDLPVVDATSPPAAAVTTGRKPPVGRVSHGQ